MRAETELVVDAIRQSLDRLRRHLDYDAALVRLSELNATAEDPALWNDPLKAQTVMRERTRLESRIARIDLLSRAVGRHRIPRAGRGGRRCSRYRRREGGIASCKRPPSAPSWRRCSPAKRTAMTAISKSMPAPAGPRRRIGRKCCCACIPLGGAAQGRLDRGEPGRGSRNQVGDDPHQRRRRLRLDEDGERRALAGAHLPSTPAPGGTPASLPSARIPSSTRVSTSRSWTRTCGSTLTRIGCRRGTSIAPTRRYD